MVVIGGQVIARPEAVMFHHGFGCRNEQMGREILHGDLHGRLRNGNGYHRERLLATRLPEPRGGSRLVPGVFLMCLAAATSLLRGDRGRRVVSSEGPYVLSWELGTA